jgi:arabinogalactan endo-1,4-beta-galactosidase
MLKPVILPFLALLVAGNFSANSQTNVAANARTQPFILGADVSWTLEDEAAGATYYDHGVKMDIFDILKKYKFNYIRLRLFVNPGAPGGYSGRGREAFCDLPHVVTLAKRAKAAGMGLLLDIHYSDTWSSPGSQKKPAAWANLSFPDLTKAVHDFTYNAIYTMGTNDVAPNMVQIGNEISGGMLFPDGRASNWDNFAALLKAGIAGAKEAQPSIKIALHHHLGRSNDVMRNWLDNLISRGVNFDIIGMSCYAQAKEGNWQTNFDDLAKRYPDKQQLVLEYSAQKRYLNDLMFDTPDNKGLGTFVWEPTRHREALFDKNGVNAGGGQASNFTTDTGINQGAQPTGQPAPRPNFGGRGNFTLTTNADGTIITNRGFGALTFTTNQDGTITTNRPNRFGGFRNRNGGRYDANDLFNLYPQMADDYSHDKFEVLKPGH